MILFSSDNDPYMAANHGKISQLLLGAELIVVPNAGHFNLESSPQYREFPLLLNKILEK